MEKEEILKLNEQILGSQLSHKVHKRKIPKYLRDKPVGTCNCCKRKNVNLWKVKDRICTSCWTIIKDLCKSKYGYYHERHIPEMIHEFWKPVKCIFYDTCGNTIPRFNDKGEATKIRRKICKRCMPIYLYGYNEGQKERNKKRTRRGLSGLGVKKNAERF